MGRFTRRDELVDASNCRQLLLCLLNSQLIFDQPLSPDCSSPCLIWSETPYPALYPRIRRNHSAGIIPPESIRRNLSPPTLTTATNSFQFESFIHCGWNFTQESAGINPPESFRLNLSPPTSTAATYPINLKVSSTVDEITAMHFVYKKWPLDCASMENGNQQMRPNGRP